MNYFTSKGAQLMDYLRKYCPVMTIGSSLSLNMYFKVDPFLHGMDCRKFRNIGFQSSHIYFFVNWFFSVSTIIFDLYEKYSWDFLLQINPMSFWTGNLIMAEYFQVLIMSPDYWMNSFMLRLVPGVRWICLLLTVSVENDLKPSSNFVDVLSMHDSKSSSNTSL